MTDPPIPILLHHGFMDVVNVRLGPIAYRSFQGLDRALADRGHPILMSRVHPTASIAHRAAQLKQQLLAHLKRFPPGTRVLIIAHSMGGMDARYMISRLGMDEHVAALFTASTPHRGSPYADFALRNLRRTGVLRLAKLLNLDVQAIPDLTFDGCARFNEQTPDHPAVGYYSVSAACHWSRVPPWGMHAHRVIANAEGENDGLVSVRSSTYATHLGTWPVDHWRMLNKAFLRSGEIRDIAPNYLKAVDAILAHHAR